MGFNSSPMPSFFISSHSTIGVQFVDDDSILNHFRMFMKYFFYEMKYSMFIKFLFEENRILIPNLSSKIFVYAFLKYSNIY